MAKRSREDFEPSSPDTDSDSDFDIEYTGGGGPPASARSVIHLSTLHIPSSTSKFLHLGPESGEALEPEMRCSLPPHRGTLAFASFEEYDVHYAKTHMNRCLECRKNFPTEHFLNLHIEENHDAMISVLRERGEKTYSCFTEGCDRKCSTPQKRRMHLIDKHMFPKDYDFFVVNDGIDRRSSMLRSGKDRRRSSAAHMTEIDGRSRRRSLAMGTSSASTENRNRENKSPEVSPAGSPASPKEYEDINGLLAAMSALKFVPPRVRFGRGRGRGRGGFSRS